jgi:hypothetical protein
MNKAPQNPIEDPDFGELMEALGEIDAIMKGRPKEFAISLGVALRDWICDRWGDDSVGFDVMKEIGGIVTDEPSNKKRRR